MRIMSFADYKLERHSPVSYDIDLISPLLVVSWWPTDRQAVDVQWH